MNTKILSSAFFLAATLSSAPVMAGGVHCKFCPAESDACAPIPGCPYPPVDYFSESADAASDASKSEPDDFLQGLDKACG